MLMEEIKTKLFNRSALMQQPEMFDANLNLVFKDLSKGQCLGGEMVVLYFIQIRLQRVKRIKTKLIQTSVKNCPK